MKRLVNLIILFCMLPMAKVAADDNTSTRKLQAFEQKLQAFEQASGDKKRVEAANHFFELLASEGFTDPTVFNSNSHPDTVSMNVWYYAAEYLYGMQRYVEAIGFAQRALPLTKNNKDFTWQSETLNILAQATFNLSDWPTSIDYAKRLLDIDQQHGDKDRIASTLNTIANIYLAARQPEEAEKFITRAEDVCRKTDNTMRLSAISGIESEVYLQLKQYDKALDYAKQALALARENKREDKAAIHLSQMAAVWLETDKSEEARQVLQQAIPILRKAGNRKSLGICLNQMGEAERLEKHLAEAASYFEQARQLFAEMGDAYNESRSLHGLYKAFYKSNPERAKAFHDRYMEMRDSLYESDMQAVLSSYNAQYNNDKLQHEKEEVKHNLQLVKAWGIAACFILLLGIAFLLYAYRQKVKSNRFLHDLQRIRDTLTTHITHEFRTPLTLILGLTHKVRLATAKDLDQLHEEATIAEKASRQLMQLNDQMLDIAKAQSNQKNLNWERGDVVPLLTMLTERYQHQANSKHIDVIFTLPSERKIEMDVVADYLEKITGNLIANAITHTPKFGRVHITAHTITNGKGSDDKKLVLTVADTGNGINKKDMPHIFEPFYRSTDGTDHRETGLQLLLVKQLTESLGGTLEVTSKEGKGSSFTVTLPMTVAYDVRPTPLNVPNDMADAPPLLLPGEKKDNEEPTDERQRILIVEDNHDVAYYTGSLLASDYELIYAGNGHLGIEKAEHLIPDLIVTDVTMPEMDGLELCRYIRQQEAICHIPIIIVSARANEQERIAGLEAGADAYLQKPFNIQEFKTTVHKLLELRQMLHRKYTSPVVSNGENKENTYTKAQSQFVGRVNDLVYSLMKHGNVDINTVAAHLFMSPSQFRRKFTSITGETPASYIMNIRLSNAQRLIDAHPDWSISEVADRCGFSDSAHFTNAFKRAFGMTPTQFAHRAK